MEVCKTIATRCTRDPKRRRPDGRLLGNVLFYAINKQGKFAGGSIYPNARMSVHDGEQAVTFPAMRFTRSDPPVLRWGVAKLVLHHPWLPSEFVGRFRERCSFPPLVETVRLLGRIREKK